MGAGGEGVIDSPRTRLGKRVWRLKRGLVVRARARACG